MKAVILLAMSLGISASAASKVQADFNGDGFADLAIGVPGESVGNQWRAGAVNIVYGSGEGLAVAGGQIWTQGAPGVDSLQVLGEAEGGDRFGSAVAVGDFNRDGFSDLAVGVPYEDVGNIVNAGAVNIIYGGIGGLKVAQNQIWTLTAPGVDSLQLPGEARPNVYFGEVLITGDFNGDGRDDLAIGGPFEDLARGVVRVLYGASGGLGSNPQRWSLDSPGVPGTGNVLDQFGAALASGDFNGDGRDDLAIGIPGDMAGSEIGAGAVTLLFGSSAGLMASNQRWSQATSGILGVAEEGDGFGSALAAGDFNGDTLDDLAIGVPYETVGNLPSAGAVNVLYGRFGEGLRVAGNQIWTQTAPGVDSLQTVGTAEAGDWFGSALVAGNLAGGFTSDDLAVGVPGESVGAVPGAGAVNLIFGGAGGLDVPLNQIWTQSARGVDSRQTHGVAEPGDGFGASLSAGNFNNFNRDHLVVGVPFEGVGSQTRAGAVEILNLWPDVVVGPPPWDHQIWTQGAAGVDSLQTEGVAEREDGFGFLPGSSTLRPW